MTDHDHTSDPSNDPGADDRIDALARSAGSELRRPAPADGIARVQRAKRRRQTAQLGGAGVAAVAILAVGALAVGGGGAGPTVVPATVSTVDTPDTTTPPTGGPESTVPDTTDASPPTSEPPDTSGSVPPDAAGAPTVVYTAADLLATSGQQTLVDPVTGEVIEVQPIDPGASQAAQNALLGRTFLEGVVRDDGTEWFTTDWTVAGLTITVETLPTEVSDLGVFAPATLERFDRCGQSNLSLSGSLGSDGAVDLPANLPERVRSVAISADGRRLVTMGGTCSESGTLADGLGTTATLDVAVTVFSLDDLGSSGIVLADGMPAFQLGQLTFSPDGRFLAVQTSAGFAAFRFFDLEENSELDVAPELDAGRALVGASDTEIAEAIATTDEGECTVTGTRWSRFIGPWMGDSSVALQAACPTGSTLLVRDLASGEELRVDLPVEQASISFVADVDLDQDDRPANAWFTLCHALTATCWIGQGDGPLIELPDTAEASFLPLGFVAGG